VVAGHAGDAGARPIDPAAKLQCVSYAPFRAAQNPLNPALHIDAAQIAETLPSGQDHDCVPHLLGRHGVDQVPALAARSAWKVIQGIWLGSNKVKDRLQIESAVKSGQANPGVISSVVVGNEVCSAANDRLRPRRADPFGQGAGGVVRSGDLCRRLGILAASSRGL